VVKVGSGGGGYLLGGRVCEGNVAIFYLTLYCRTVCEIIGNGSYHLIEVIMSDAFSVIDGNRS
jgi:hypothetical protein